jgi:hypothetical protein
MVGLIVLAAILQALRILLPFGARVYIARKTQGRLPDRIRIWFVGGQACEKCK